MIAIGGLFLVGACSSGSDGSEIVVDGPVATVTVATDAATDPTPIPPIPTAVPTAAPVAASTPIATSQTDTATPTVEGPPTPIPASDSGFGVEYDAAIDSLVQDCLGGMDMACDVLLAFAVPQREVGRTCGGRGTADDGFCLDGVARVTELEPWFDDDSAAIAAIGQACGDGDMTSCDFLYYRSGLESQWSTVGATCSGRVEAAFPTCRDAGL